MPPKLSFPFLNLPRELRDIVYGYYVSEDYYHFDYDSGKLRTPNGPVNLAFMYTCRTINDEMRGLALKNNTIAFSTVYSNSERKQAHNFGALMTRIHEARSRAFIVTGLDSSRGFMTQEVFSELAKQWPQFISADYLYNEWDVYRACDVRNSNGAGSDFRDFVDHALSLLGTGFTEHVFNSRPKGRYPRDTFLPLDLDPWMIPSSKDSAKMSKKQLPTEAGPYSDSFRNRLKFRYSAAAAAIKFLRSLPVSTRKCIRNVILHEDHEAVAFPSCHARGLIPFCLENSVLHFERRVNLWRTMLPAVFGSMDDTKSRRIEELERRLAPGDHWQFDYMQPTWITKAFGLWIDEVLALPAAGMPPNSFSLSFDFNPIPDQSIEIFQMVLRDAVLQSAIQKYCQQRSLAPKPFDLPRQSLSPEDLWLSNEVYQENRDLIIEEGGDRHTELRPQTSEIAPPLPSWTDLQRELLIPQDEYDALVTKERQAEARSHKLAKEKSLMQA